MKKFNYTNYFIKHLSIYTIANFLEKISVFILLPIYTNFLTQTEFGQLSLGLAFATITLTICDLGFSAGFFRFYDKYKKKERQKKYFSSYLITYISWTLIVIIIYYIFNKSFSTLIFNSPEYSGMINLILLYVFFHSLFISLIVKYRIEGKSKQYALYNLTLTISRILLTTVFLIYFNYKLYGVFFGFLISNIILSIILLILNFKYIQFYINFNFIKKILKFGSPLLFTGIFFLILELSDKFIIKYYYNSYNLIGKYELNYKLASIMLFIITPFSLLWPNLVYSFKDFFLKKYINRIFGIYASLLLILNFSIILFSKILIDVFANKKYFVNDKIIILLTVGYMFYGIYFFTNLAFFLKNKTFKIFLISLFAACLNLILNFLLIPEYELNRAATATLISYLVMTAISYIFSYKQYNIKIFPGDFIKLFLLNFLLFFYIYYIINLYKFDFYFEIIFKLLIILGFMIFNYMLIKKNILFKVN
jgi:O-antigen/teichoic acid export membrane protein